jgi:septum formation protein
MTAPVVLASQSPSRAALLESAGVSFDKKPAHIDESALIEALLAEKHAPREIADALAELKAERISRQLPGPLVVGADQVLVCDGRIFQKAEDLAGARASLLELRGKVHELIAAVAVARGGAVIWRHVDRARLRMRDFSDAFLDRYLERNGERLLSSVGCYRLEEEGSQLFDKIEGDYFTILGLPLLPLLGFLRQHEALET